MVRIHLASLDEFVSCLGRLDYEAAKVASGKVMEDHLRMGTLMFSLQTMETMYTSMDYLTPGNFRRGNEYLLDQYTPLPRQLDNLLIKLVAEYEEEHQRLISLRMQPTPRSSATPSVYGGTPHGSGVAIDSQRRRSDRVDRFPSAFNVQSRPASDRGAGHHSPLPQAGADPAEMFDPNLYIANMEEAERVLGELETIKQFVGFVTKFVEVRRIMIVLYRFSAVTGPVLHVHKLAVMLRQCTAILKTIESHPLYASLLDQVRHEVCLVQILVDWNSHIAAYDFVQSTTHMRRAKALLKKWLGVLQQCSVQGVAAPRRSTGGDSTYDAISDALGGRRERDGARPAGQGSGHGLLFAALAKSTQIVQSLLGRGSGSGSGSAAQDSEADGARGITVWLSAWVDHLSFKTTAYFQQTIVPQRLLHLGDIPAQAGQAAVMADIWSRTSLTKANLSELITEFLHANDGLYVTLLFESSARHPFSADGFAVVGTRPHVSDYRVQACAVLSCYSNQRLLLSRGVSVSESLIHDVHSTRRSPADRGATESQQPSDVEWFRQNCLPDILYALDGNRSVLDLELLGASPLLKTLGADIDHLLAELCETVHVTIEEAEAKLSLSKRTDRGADGTAEGARTGAASGVAPGPWFSQMPDAFKLSVLKPNAPVARQPQPQQQLQENHTADAAYHHPGGSPGATAVPTHLPEADVDASNISQPALPADGHGNEGDSSLYSTYLQKSHLRNDAQQGPPALWRGSSGTSMKHHSRPRTEHGDHAQAGGAPGDGQQHPGWHGRRASRADLAMAGQSSAADMSAAGQDLSPRDRAHVHAALKRAATGDINSLGAVSRASIHTQPGPGGEAGDDSMAAAGLPHPRGHPRVTSAIEHDALPWNSRRSATGPASGIKQRQSRVSTSIRSFFWNSLQPAAHPNAPSTASTGSLEDEITRRVRCGEQLTELFGSWCSDDEDVPESVTTPRGSSNFPEFAHPLSFSTPARASIAPAAGTSALAGGAPGAEDHSGRFVLRPPRPSGQSKPPAAQRHGSRAYTTLLAGEFASAEHPHHRIHASQTAPSHGQRLDLLQPAAAAPVGNRPVPPAAPGGAEGYTYLYSRVGLPNVALVAVLLDTDKGLDRRRKAEHAWSGIVDAVRGTVLFEQLMAPPG